MCVNPEENKIVKEPVANAATWYVAHIVMHCSDGTIPSYFSPPAVLRDKQLGYHNQGFMNK